MSILNKETHYKLLADQSHNIIGTFTPDGIYTYVSPACKTLLGYSPEELIGQPFVALLHPDDRAAIHDEYKMMLVDKQKHIAIYRIQNSHHVFVWFESISQPIINTDTGEIEEIFSVSKSISKRLKQSESLLKSAKEIGTYKYALLQSSIVAVTDQRGIINFANENFCKISKYSAEELIGQDHRIINSGHHSKEEFRNLWRTIAAGHTWKGELKNKAKDGSIYWVDTTIIPFLNDENKPYQYLAIRNDITKRKQTEEKIIQTEKLLAEAQQISKTGNWNYYFEEKKASFSDELVHMYGLKNREKLTERFFLSMIHHEDKYKVRNITLNCIENKDTAEFDHRIIRTDGEERILHTKIKVEVNEEGVPVRIYGISQDITEIKKAQTELIESYQQIKIAAERQNSIINSLTAHIALLDNSGKIIEVNNEWKKFALENFAESEHFYIGENYIEKARNAKGQNEAVGIATAKAIEDIIGGKIDHFSMEYPCFAKEITRWFKVSITPLNQSKDGGVVISHTNITDRKIAELNLNNLLEELELRVEERTKELQRKNKDITDSIIYSKRLQVALLPKHSSLSELFPQSLIYSKPRDIVSGDFFWSHKSRNKIFIVVADCTGHGVPGALMSIIGNNLLNKIIINQRIENPAEILELLDRNLEEAVQGVNAVVNDGMDIGLCVVDTYFNEVYFSGAYRPLFYTDEKGTINELAANPFPIGGGRQFQNKKFETQRFNTFKGQRIYLSTDGYYSQFGGPKDKKFMKSKFRETLHEIQSESMLQQKVKLTKIFNDWKANAEQIDDIMVVGFEI
jgi:PAS domain S-box-containing protein